MVLIQPSIWEVSFMVCNQCQINFNYLYYNRILSQKFCHVRVFGDCARIDMRLIPCILCDVLSYLCTSVRVRAAGVEGAQSRYYYSSYLGARVYCRSIAVFASILMWNGQCLPHKSLGMVARYSVIPRDRWRLYNVPLLSTMDFILFVAAAAWDAYIRLRYVTAIRSIRILSIVQGSARPEACPLARLVQGASAVATEDNVRQMCAAAGVLRFRQQFDVQALQRRLWRLRQMERVCSR